MQKSSEPGDMNKNTNMNVKESANKIGIIVTGGPYNATYFPIMSFPVAIGRTRDNQIALTRDSYVSSWHCEIYFAGGQYWVKDLASRNGTFVNGNRIYQPKRIIPGKTTIYVGRTWLLLDARKHAEEQEANTQALKNVVRSGSIIIPSSSFFEKPAEESLFVVDICNSTGLANQYGEKALLKIVYVLAEIITRLAEKNQVQFLKCTGDGFFATFKQTKEGLRVACGLLHQMERLFQKAPELINPGLRIALHRGPVVTDKNGDRLGVACNLIFRLEKATLDSQVSAPEQPCELPEKDRILLTEDAVKSLGGELSECFTYLGEFRFKGFADPIRVNLLNSDPENLLNKLTC